MTDAPHDPPEVLEAYWDRSQVDTLFADLQRGATIKRVHVRTAAASHRPIDEAVSLEQARERLDDCHTKAIQIYYDFGGQGWCDTMFLLPDKIRIIRTMLPAAH